MNLEKDMEPTIHQYASPEAMRTLCEHIDMPAEATERLITHASDMDLAVYEKQFSGLFSLDTGHEAVQAIQLLSKTEEDPTGDTGLKALAVYLMAVRHTHTVYKSKGISDTVFYDTMKAFTRFVNEHKASFGAYGFDRDFWIYRHHSAAIFRLGTLEFEMVHLHEGAEPIGPAGPGSPVLSVHIPSDATLSMEELENSYRTAKRFFAEFFPEFKYETVFCSTWLLSPTLKEVLKPGSGILNFQSHYEITGVDPEANSAVTWIYKREYENYEDLPEDTSLRRGIKKILLDGRKVGSGKGYVRDFEEL